MYDTLHALSDNHMDNYQQQVPLHAWDFYRGYTTTWAENNYVMVVPDGEPERPQTVLCAQLIYGLICWRRRLMNQ